MLGMLSGCNCGCIMVVVFGGIIFHVLKLIPPLSPSLLLSPQQRYEGDGLFPPTDDRVVETINVLSDLFEDTFPINNYDTLKGYGGILFGRYQGK